MSKPIANPNTFALDSGNVSAATLDASFAAPYAAINDVNTYTTGNSDSGIVNAYVVANPSTLTITLAAYVRVMFVAAHTNTLASTANVFATGVRDIVRPDGTALLAGDIVAGQLADICYTGTKWQLMNPAASNVTPGNIVTGMSFVYMGTTAPSGYVLCDGKTIGNGASGGTERANADTVNLFTLLWNAMTNTEAPVSGGRGANAAADFAANKTITLPDARGRVIIGDDNMGGVTAGRITAAGCGIDGTVLGTSGGAQGIGLAISNMPAHVHTQQIGSQTQAPQLWGAQAGASGPNATVTTAGEATGFSWSQPVTTQSTGSGTAHFNVQPSLVLTMIIAL